MHTFGALIMLPSNSFGINTCKSVSKQSTLTTLESTLVKNRGRGVVLLLFRSALELAAFFRHTGAGLREFQTSLTGRTCASNPKLLPGWTWPAGRSTSGRSIYFIRVR